MSDALAAYETAEDFARAMYAELTRKEDELAARRTLLVENSELTNYEKGGRNTSLNMKEVARIDTKLKKLKKEKLTNDFVALYELERLLKRV